MHGEGARERKKTGERCARRRQGAPVAPAPSYHSAPLERSPLLARHLQRGARLAERPEAPGHDAPLSFGDVPAEYAAARTACALFDQGDRGALRVSGRDALDFLHRLLANHVKALAPGRGNRNLLLAPKGKVQFDFELVRAADHVSLSTPPGTANALAAALERFHFSEDVRIEATSALHAPLELVGPSAAAVLARVLGSEPALEPDGWPTLTWREGALSVGRLDSGALRVDAGPARAPELWDALVQAGARPAGLAARDCVRVEDGRALFGLDIDENVYPQEAGLEGAFALDKGCYVGQEVVAKIDTYGGLNKRLVGLRIAHAEPLPRGTPLVLAEDGELRELGLITSWAYSFVLDTGLALGYVKRRHQEPGTRFELGGGHGQATLVALPVRAG